jgi:restriction system-associated AAA family ATPase
MKLLRLKLNVPFRSLAAGFEIHFLREWDYESCLDFQPYCLAGRNGSGKSNVLEALAAIFYHLECVYLDTLPDGFRFGPDNPDGFQGEKSTPDAFELGYFFKNENLRPIRRALKPSVPSVAHIRITKTSGDRPRVFWLNRSDYEDSDEIELRDRSQVKEFLPKFILGYSSGHNEILSLPFFKMRFIHFDEYLNRLIGGLDYGGKPEGGMIYLDDQFSQAILLCHYLFPSEAVTKIFEEKIGLKDIRRFRIIVRRAMVRRFDPSRDTEEEKRNRFFLLTTENWVDPRFVTVELTAKLSGHYNANNEFQAGLIDKLIQCSTAHYQGSPPEKEGDASDLILDYWVDDETRKAFQYHFGVGVGGSEDLSKAASALNLFQSLQTLLTLNYYKVDDQTKAELYRSDSLYVNETIPLPASHERIMRFKDFELIKEGVTSSLYGKSLSDGEHQLAHTIGLCLLFRHEQALFLLDEPETHLNPDWRASYISTLRAALEADAGTKNVMREVLLTSHSPFIISDCRQENVLVFEKDQGGKVEWHYPEFNTFGASSNAITIKIFGQKETIGDYALTRLEALRQRLGEGESPDALIDQAGDELGDSVEKTIFINQALDKQEGK